MEERRKGTLLNRHHNNILLIRNILPIIRHNTRRTRHESSAVDPEQYSFTLLSNLGFCPDIKSEAVFTISSIGAANKR